MMGLLHTPDVRALFTHSSVKKASARSIGSALLEWAEQFVDVDVW